MYKSYATNFNAVLQVVLVFIATIQLDCTQVRGSALGLPHDSTGKLTNGDVEYETRHHSRLSVQGIARGGTTNNSTSDIELDDRLTQHIRTANTLQLDSSTRTHSVFTTDQTIGGGGSGNSSISSTTQDYSQTHTNVSQYRPSSSSSSSSAAAAKLQSRRSLFDQDSSPECAEYALARRPVVYGIRCDEAEIEDGTIVIKADKATEVLLIGQNLYSNLSIALTTSELNAGDDCTHMARTNPLAAISRGPNVVEVLMEQPASVGKLHLCVREFNSSTWHHQGYQPWLKIQVRQDFLPPYLKIITIACLLGLSGLFSGLNLGLMALDKNELQVIMKCGSEDEKRYARAIEPVRRRGNYLLCSILFSNTLINSTISVFLEELSDGLLAIIMSTVLIVLFGEILPQAFCSRHGLAVGAKTVLLTYFCMIVTWPLSYPVSWCLDWALGEEIGHAYDRERLMEFIQVTRDMNKLESDEVNIIAGALKLKRISICDIMTRIEDVFMLDENEVLDFTTIQAIVAKGYSRIPVHASGNLNSIVAILFAKDLALVDPDDRLPVRSMINFYNHPGLFVMEETKLDKVLAEFKTGKSHMAIVQRINNDGDSDPYYETIGIVTLEDVIEEIMQMEINDETDTLTDNRKKKRRNDAQVRRDFSHFSNLGAGESSYNVISPQLCYAAYQFLATTVEPFTSKYLSDSVLKRLLSQKIFYKVKESEDEKRKRLYTAGEPADYFIMILEGRVHVVCGKEDLFFDGGPFSFFGKAALSQSEKMDTITSGDRSIELPSSRRESVVKSQATIGRRESIIKGLSNQLIVAQKGSKETSLTENLEVQGAAGASGSSDKTPVESSAGERTSVAHFIPDYSVSITVDTSYLKVTRNDYITALKATLMETGITSLGLDEVDVSKETTPMLAIESKPNS